MSESSWDDEVHELPAPTVVSTTGVRVKCVHVSTQDVEAKVMEEAGLHDCMRQASVYRFTTEEAEGSHPRMTIQVELLGPAQYALGQYYLVNITQE